MCSIDDETLKKLEKIKKDMQEPEHVEAVDRKIKILKGNKTVTK